MAKVALIAAVLALAVGGCAQGGGGGDAAKPRSASGRLDFLKNNAADWDSYVPSSDPVAWGRNPALDGAIPAQCGLPPPPPPPSAPVAAAAFPALAAAAIPVVAGWVIDYLISEASSAAQKRLAEYSAVIAGGLRFGAPKPTGFYSSISPPAMAWKCVRFTHTIKPKDKDGKPLQEVRAFEVIAKIEVASSQDSLLITPLRLYFAQPTARTGSHANSTFGVAVGMTFDALWQALPNGEGKTSRVWSATALSQKIEGINRGSADFTRQRFYYYNLGNTSPGDKSDVDNKPIQVPLVPWSVNRKAPFGSGLLTVTMAETGDPPAILEFVAGTLKDHGKDIGDFLKDAAKKAVSDDSSN